MALLVETRRRPRWRALLMVVVVLVLTVTMAWTGTGTSDALVGNIVKRVAVPAARFVAKNAIRIGEAAQNAQKVALDKAVKIGYQTALWGYNTWKDANEVDGMPMPAPVKQSVDSPSEGLPGASAMGGSLCTVEITGATFAVGSVTLTQNVVLNGSGTAENLSRYCAQGGTNTLGGQMWVQRSCTLGSETFTFSASSLSKTNQSYGCFRAGLPAWNSATVSRVYVYDAWTDSGPYQQPTRLKAPAEFINPDPAFINQGVMTGRKRCVNETDPGDVQMIERAFNGNEMLPMVPCPPGYFADWLEYEHQATPTSPVRKLGRIEQTPGMYPDCAKGQCVLKVEIDGETCVVGLDKCYDWMHTVAPERIKCSYGPYAVGLDECESMEFAFRTNAGLTVDPSEQLAPGRLVPATPDAVPAPQIGPGTTVRPDPYPNANPGGGTNPGGNPNPNPGGSQTTLPTSGSNPNPNPGGRPITNPETLGNCISSSWSWNPVSWVFEPGKCVMVWAFVPKKEAVAGVQTRLRTSVDKSGAAGWFQAGNALVGLPGDGGGCGVTITFPLTNTDFHILDSCSSPMSTVAGICKAFLTVVIVTLGVLHGTRAVAGAFGYQFSMGGKGSADGD